MTGSPSNYARIAALAVAVCIGAWCLAAYAFGHAEWTTMGGAVPMALPTAICLVLIGLSILTGLPTFRVRLSPDAEMKVLRAENILLRAQNAILTQQTKPPIP